MSAALDWLGDLADSLAVALVAAGTARLAYHLYQVKAGKRRLLGLVLLLEAVVVVMMALLALGIADWFAMTPSQVAGVAVVLGWLGPKGLEALAAAWITRRTGGGK